MEAQVAVVCNGADLAMRLLWNVLGVRCHEWGGLREAATVAACEHAAVDRQDEGR